MGFAEDELSEQDPDDDLIYGGDYAAARERKNVKPKALKTIHQMEKLLTQLQKREYANERGFEF